MKVHCPECSAQVPAAHMNLQTGWGKCDACQELFPLSEVVPDFPAPGEGSEEPHPRPFNARAILERTPETLLIHVPAEGVRAATLGLLLFATFWLGFVTFWTLGALGVLFGQGPGAFNWAFASFSIPFWVAGFGMLGAVAWSLWGTKSVQIDRDEMRTYQRCLVWSRFRRVERERVQHARHHDPAVKGAGQDPHAVEIVYRAGSFVLPADSAEEEEWLIAEINGFVKSLAA